jgi:Zn-dependent M28 family amino/carboxypeptidase
MLNMKLLRSQLFSCCVLALVLPVTACSKQAQTPTQASAALQDSATTSAVAAPSAAMARAESAGPKPDISGNHVLQYVKEVVGFGPRPPGSSGHAKLEQYILSKLKGVDVEQDRFTAQTPVGKFPINNIIAKFPGKKNGVIVVAGHYDTLYSQPKDFVGANDGGSSTAVLLALADYYRGKQIDGFSVWLVWTDGEEAFVNWTDTDSLYGTRHLAQRWQQDGTAKQLQAFILVDMIGDADLDILKDNNSTPWLNDLVYQAASNLGYQSHFFQQANAIDDDHMPLARIGVPVVDLIDFSYGYNNVFWHTPQDTVDKLSPQSLAITSDVVLETIRLLNSR